MKKLDIINRKYGRLTVISENITKATELKEKVSRRYYDCKCDCGGQATVSQSKLISGHTKSCGCIGKEQGIEKAKLMNTARTKYTPKEASARKAYKERKYDDGNITYEQFFDMSQLDCVYCGAKPSNISNIFKCDDRSAEQSKISGDFIHNGLDRIDNFRPHDLDNCTTCCKHCNWAKNNMTMQEWTNHIERIYNHFIKSNK